MPVGHVLVLMFHPPAKKFLAVYEDGGHMCWVISEVLVLARIVAKIKKEGWDFFAGKLNIFVIIVADNPEQSQVRVGNNIDYFATDVFFVMNLCFAILAAPYTAQDDGTLKPAKDRNTQILEDDGRVVNGFNKTIEMLASYDIC